MATHLDSTGPKSFRLHFGDRPVRVRHASETVMSSLECPDCGPSHGFIALGVTTDGPATRGLYVGLTPNDARSYAAALLDLANQLDGGKGAQ